MGKTKNDVFTRIFSKENLAIIIILIALIGGYVVFESFDFSAEKISGFPSGVGQTLFYENGEGGETTFEVIGTTSFENKDMYKISVEGALLTGPGATLLIGRQGRVWRYGLGKEFLFYNHDSRVLYDSLSEKTVSFSESFVPYFQLYMGKWWRGKGLAEGDEFVSSVGFTPQSSNQISFEVKKSEEVETPAGSFTALVVDGTSHGVTKRFWVEKETGIILRINIQGGVQVVELVNSENISF